MHNRYFVNTVLQRNLDRLLAECNETFLQRIRRTVASSTTVFRPLHKVHVGYSSNPISSQICF